MLSATSTDGEFAYNVFVLRIDKSVKMLKMFQLLKLVLEK
jgi:hypothetical protein